MIDSLLQAVAPLFVPLTTLDGSPITPAELLAVALSLAMVVANMRVHPVAWPLAITSSALYALLFLEVKLYGEAGLQLFFIAMAAWGWWSWQRGTGADGGPLRVRRLRSAARGRVLLLTLLAWPLLGLLLQRATDSNTPWLDALPTVGSIAATWLLGRKLIENWPAWVAVNLVSIALFVAKGLWLTVGLYALFTLLALVGWRAWQRLDHDRALA